MLPCTGRSEGRHVRRRRERREREKGREGREREREKVLVSSFRLNGGYRGPMDPNSAQERKKSRVSKSVSWVAAAQS